MPESMSRFTRCRPRELCTKSNAIKSFTARWKFSLPIYRNQPIVVLTNRKQRKRFGSYTTLKEVFSDPSLIMATIRSFSYGRHIDTLIKGIAPRMHVVPAERKQLPRLIDRGRASYLLTAPEEIEMLLASADVNVADFLSIPMNDVPAGNQRHLMCSRRVSDETIQAINGSIRKMNRTLAGSRATAPPKRNEGEVGQTHPSAPGNTP